MDLRTYLNSLPPSNQVALATGCGTTLNYLRKSFSVGQLLRAELCVSIEHATHGAVTRRDLRPDDWQRIWPELAQQVEGEA